MATQGKSFRLSRPAVEKLRVLGLLYGSQVRALEVALDRLYNCECIQPKKQEALGGKQ
jgi:hypothetical protein